jgi:thiamine biosynthesis lipoprotein
VRRVLARVLVAALVVTLLAGVALVVLDLFTPRRSPALVTWLPTAWEQPADALREKRQVATRAYMGGIPAHLTCVGLTPDAFASVMARVDARIEELTARWSAWRDDSVLTRLNASSEASFEVDAETATLLARSRAFTEASEGALDVTVGPVVALWKAAEERDALPGAEELAGAKALVGPGLWSLEGRVVRRAPGVRFDVNAIGEGAMADEAVSLLRDAGCGRVLVELGGDVGLWHAPGQPPFRIGVKDPAAPDRLLATLEVEGGAVDTSGDYSRFFTIGGRRYGHVVDPRTAAPVPAGIASATVVAPDTLTADAWDTALVVLGWERAQQVVEERPELEAVLVHHDGRMWVSSGLQGKVHRVGEGSGDPPGGPTPSPGDQKR